MDKTIRLRVPQWQGDNNPLYSLGEDLLSFLVPKNLEHNEIEVSIPKYEEPLIQENDVTAQSIVVKNVGQTAGIIQEENPDKIITLGGDCLASQAPFEYLHRKYRK